jgi:hypothetical protein
MFVMCSNMKWAQLPIDGGIYAQDPRMLKKFRYIWGEQAKHDREEAKKREDKMGKNNDPHGTLSRPSRYR